MTRLGLGDVLKRQRELRTVLPTKVDDQTIRRAIRNIEDKYGTEPRCISCGLPIAATEQAHSNMHLGCAIDAAEQITPSER